MNLLRIDSSIQGPASAGSQLADIVVAEAVAGHPGVEVVDRHLATDPVSSTTWADAVIGSATPEADRTAAQRDALALAASLADELRAADLVVLASPLYNFGISQHLKTWIDLVLAGAPVGSRLLDGTPTVLVVTRGGAYGPGTPREGWDHATSYVTRILSDVWGADLTVVEREFTLVGINPALDAFRDLAASMKTAAEQAATTAGTHLAHRTTTAPASAVGPQ
ncbi:MAG: NAD(P)H-dependent oxidoreductase [Ilumatobacteraceae bacterium]|nr:NAD(P)H-dependent oxidoreductase [Acidimicrobiales bacterium]MCB9395648.1 NAD(P)H-dependent oxidoreductase [Acidimicrobiaceae bacterium]